MSATSKTQVSAVPKMTPREGNYVVKLLYSRNGLASLVTLDDGSERRVLNIATGRDLYEEFDHITINISPPEDGWDLDLFNSSEIRQVETLDGEILFRSSGASGEPR